MTTTITQTVGFVGNVATEPEVRFSKAGKAWCSFRLSVKPYVPGATEQPQPEFYDLVCFGSLAENVADTCRKGSRVVVSGRIEDSSWTGNDGTEHSGQKVVADGLGLDLRFTGTTSTRPTTTTPTQKPTPMMDELVGPQRTVDYSDQPF
jgi:single-strand DNA-binding protein